jgi:hypothetical protein
MRTVKKLRVVWLNNRETVNLLGIVRNDPDVD